MEPRGNNQWEDTLLVVSVDSVGSWRGPVQTPELKDGETEDWGEWWGHRHLEYLIWTWYFQLISHYLSLFPSLDYVIWEDRKESWGRARSQIDLGSNPCSVTYQVGGSMCYPSSLALSFLNTKWINFILYNIICLIEWLRFLNDNRYKMLHVVLGNA